MILKINTHFFANGVLPLDTWIEDMTDRQYTYERNTEPHSRNHCCRSKAIIGLRILSVGL